MGDRRQIMNCLRKIEIMRGLLQLWLVIKAHNRLCSLALYLAFEKVLRR